MGSCSSRRSSMLAKKYPIVNMSIRGRRRVLAGGARFAAAHRDMQSLAELGFVVVCIDGMGTPGRSKAFHEAYYGDHGRQYDSGPGGGDEGAGGEVSVDRYR